jgi:hypothetical protein
MRRGRETARIPPGRRSVQYPRRIRHRQQGSARRATIPVSFERSRWRPPCFVA